MYNTDVGLRPHSRVQTRSVSVPAATAAPLAVVAVASVSGLISHHGSLAEGSSSPHGPAGGSKLLGCPRIFGPAQWLHGCAGEPLRKTVCCRRWASRDTRILHVASATQPLSAAGVPAQPRAVSWLVGAHQRKAERGHLRHCARRRRVGESEDWPCLQRSMKRRAGPWMWGKVHRVSEIGRDIERAPRHKVLSQERPAGLYRRIEGSRRAKCRRQLLRINAAG